MHVATILAAAIVVILLEAGSARAQWTTDTSNNNIYYNAGKVGIGTTTPLMKLHVAGGDVNIDDGQGYRGGGEFLLGRGLTANQIRMGSGHPSDFLSFFSGGYERLRVDASGNFGIGTTSPAAKFHFHDGTDANLWIRNAVSPAWMEIASANDAASAFKPLQFTAEKFNFSNGNVGIGITSPTARLHVAAPSSGRAFDVTGPSGNWAIATQGSTSSGNSYGQSILAGTNSSDTAFQVYDAGGTLPRFLVRGDGNVSIGTTYAGSKLNVGGGDVNVDNGQGYRAGGEFLIGRGLAANQLRVGSGSPSDYLSLFSGGYERFRIDANGRIGIGITNPGYLFDVQGGSINASGGLCINGSCKTNWSELSPWENNSGSVSYSAGNVGVGTTSPHQKLEVAGLGAFTTVPVSPDPGGSIGAATLIGYNSTSDFGFVNAINTGVATKNLSLQPYGGNVGIGTTGPHQKLEVAGLGVFTTVPVSPDPGGSIGAATLIGYNSTSDFGFVNAINTGVATKNLSLQPYGGNVAIGTPTPTDGYRLDVNGDLKISGNGNINANGTIEANIIKAKYQDVAEWVPSSEQLPAGTVVVLDSSKSNQVTSSSVSYDTRVAGVISQQPGIALGEQSDSKVLVATTGRVKVKVDASKGAIHIGDLLVTSDIPGVAMKSEAVNLGGVQIHRPGTLIGKALEPLEKGKGEILVLLSLQ
jgi:hypothetical protein